jgi:hypothetical protein
MLAEIDKDARAIAALQARLNALETDQLAEKTRLMVHASLMEDEVRLLKREVRAFRKEAVLLVDSSGTPIELEPVTQFAGRAIFKIPKTVRECVVNKSLRLMTLWYGVVPSSSITQLFSKYSSNSVTCITDPVKFYKDESETNNPTTVFYELCFQGETKHILNPAAYGLSYCAKVCCLVEAL